MIESMAVWAKIAARVTATIAVLAAFLAFVPPRIWPEWAATVSEPLGAVFGIAAVLTIVLVVLALVLRRSSRR